MSNIVSLVDFEADISKPFPISARELWLGLQSQDNFVDWIKDQIIRAKLIENVDYLIYREKPINSGRGRSRHQYMLKINSAKNIALMSNTEKGNQYRAALINLEEKYFAGELTTPALDQVAKAKISIGHWLDIYELFNVPKHLAQIEAIKETKKLTGVDLSPVLRLSRDQDNIEDKDVMLEPTECAKRLDMKSAQDFNKKLEAIGLQTKSQQGFWQPTSKAEGQYSKHAWKNGSKSGYNLKWKFDFVRELVNK